MARIFAYIVHKGGVADDSAAELPVAAAKVDAAQPPTAIVTGWGADLDASATACVQRTPRSGRSPRSLSPIQTPNWSARPWSVSCHRRVFCSSPMLISASTSRPGFPSVWTHRMSQMSWKSKVLTGPP